jgi:hypothetical protein
MMMMMMTTTTTTTTTMAMPVDWLIHYRDKTAITKTTKIVKFIT